MAAEALSNEQQIIQGDAIGLWLKDASVQACIERVKTDLHQQFLQAKTPEAVQQVWLKSKALDDLLQEFQATVQNGRVARVKAEKAQQQYAGAKRR